MIIKRLWPYLRQLWVRLVVALIAMALVASINTALMWLLKFLIDSALTQKDFSTLQTGVSFIISGFSLKAILWYSHTYLANYIGHSISRQLRDDTYAHLYKLSMGFFNDKTSARILSQLTNDVTILQTMLTSCPTILVRDGLTVLGLIGFIMYTNLKFALICFTILPVAGFVLTNLGKKSRKASRESQEKMSDMYKTIQEALLAMPLVKSFQNEKKEIADFKQENRHYFDVMMRLTRIEARSSPIMEVLGSIILAVMLWFGGQDVVKGVWSLGSFMAFIGAAMSLYNPIKNFAKMNVQIQQGLAASERIFALLDEKATVVEVPGSPSVDPLRNEIKLENVTFAYPQSEDVLKNINLTLKKGEVVALVGQSGSGKTSIAQLLLRFYDPQKGSISWDGKDYRDVNLASLRQHIGVVTQETHLFNETIEENLRYGRQNATTEEIINAAKMAHAHDFISKFPNGYQTVIGERGAKISGGERQRIAIARAILKNPDILILDEATSALDAISEKTVQLALDELLKSRTVLMIAHRLSTIRKAHRIVVLEKGEIREEGSHEQLLASRGIYQHFFDVQTLSI